jgi:hypothetical protein
MVCGVLTPLLTPNISVISMRQFYWQRKPEYPEKTTDLSQVTDKLYPLMLFFSSTPRLNVIQTHNVSGDMH